MKFLLVFMLFTAAAQSNTQQNEPAEFCAHQSWGGGGDYSRQAWACMSSIFRSKNAVVPCKHIVARDGRTFQCIPVSVCSDIGSRGPCEDAYLYQTGACRWEDRACGAKQSQCYQRDCRVYSDGYFLSGDINACRDAKVNDDHVCLWRPPEIKFAGYGVAHCVNWTQELTLRHDRCRDVLSANKCRAAGFCEWRD